MPHPSYPATTTTTTYPAIRLAIRSLAASARYNITKSIHIDCVTFAILDSKGAYCTAIQSDPNAARAAIRAKGGIRAAAAGANNSRLEPTRGTVSLEAHKKVRSSMVVNERQRNDT